MMPSPPPAALELQTLIMVRELQDGSVCCFPLADPTLVSVGERSAALVEQRLFLEEHLREQRPEVIARFSFPPQTRLEELDLPLGRPDLPPRLQLSRPVTVACVVIPHGRDHWVVVPAISHTFHVSPEEDLRQAVSEEVARLVAARETTPQEFLALLPPCSQQLERLTVRLPPREAPVRSPGAPLSRSAEAMAATSRKVLDSVGRRLDGGGAAASGPGLLEREQELADLAALLGGRSRASVLLVGVAGAGKSALLHAWIRASREGDGARPIYALSAARLVAGMSGFGQWQERVHRVLHAAETLDAVLVFDSLGELFGDRPEEGVNLAGSMRPFLEEGRVRVVGELRPEEVDAYQAKHAGFLSCFERMTVEPFDSARAARVVQRLVDHAARFEAGRPRLDPEAVQTLIDLLDRYSPQAAYPGKAVRLYEEVRAHREGDASSTAGAVIGERELLETFSRQTGIPLFLLRPDLPLAASQVERTLRSSLVGQELAVRRVAEAVCRIKARLQPPGKPLCTFFFVGPTGVGKTELARALARTLFGSADRLTRFDMSEYGDAMASERLIRGTDRAEGLLTRRVRQQPFCVLLLDEIEKAHSAVFDLLLQVMGEGRLTDAAGHLASFENAIIIMTSNLGAAGRSSPVGLGDRPEEDDASYTAQVDRTFRPEFVNRIDHLVVFRSLSEEELASVVRIALAGIAARRGLSELGITVEAEEGAVRLLAREGRSAQLGARALRRHLEHRVVSPAGTLLARLGGQARGGTLVLGAVEADDAGGASSAPILAEATHGSLRLRLFSHRAAVSRGRGVIELREISKLRGTIARHLQLDPIAEVKDRVEELTSELGAGNAPAGASRKRLSPSEITRLQIERHRLEPLWSKASAHLRELEEVEELGLEALLEGEDPRPFLEEATAAHDHCLEALYYLIGSRAPRRDSSTILVQELDDRRALDLWLPSLVSSLEARRWSLEVHLDGDRPKPGDAWSAERRWGPPRKPDWALERIAEADRPLSVLLRMRGPYANVALALECGLHATRRAPGGEAALMMVFHIAQRADLGDGEWVSGTLKPRLGTDFTRLKKYPEFRRYDDPDGPCLIYGGVRRAEVPLADYWARYERIGLAHLLGCIAGEIMSLEDLFQAELPDGREDR
jgi:ATP-dependent Clp protease ATP-binding subunit ClpC